jgi:CBS domain-containing protein/gamma-glutamyl:cysteine ligase YbdK (ATP-grasp superfamily)
VAQDRRQFTNALLRDLHALGGMLAEGRIESGVRRIGAEQEMFLTDRSWRPAPVALEVLEAVDDPHFVTEVGAFNLEINLDPQDFTGDCLRRVEDQLNSLLDRLRSVAGDRGVEVLLAGILPTIRKSDLGLTNMVDKERYHQLNTAISNLRGHEVDFYIKGVDELRMRHDSVMVEACNASFQVHLQVDPDTFANQYNIAQVLAGPVLACATNSPLLFGRRLWAETRIAVFQQSVDTRRPSHHLRDLEPRVTFGDRWLKSSVLELYREDISRFPPLLPDVEVPDPLDALARGEAPDLAALRLHTGTVWRWNRGCYGISSGVPHLRIENRVLPSGPSPLDEVANAAFWLGAMVALADRYEDITAHIEFEQAKWNFLAAARLGLDAPLVWLDGTQITAPRLALDHLLPLAHEGLTAAGVDDTDRERYLDVVERRVHSGNTGTRWLLQSLAEMRGRGTPGQRLNSLVAGMAARQRTERPVADWTLAQLDEGGGWEHDFLKVEQIMSTDFHTVNEDDPLSLVANLMDWHRIRQVLVEDGHGRLVGIVSYRALLKLLARGPVDLGTYAVADVMARDPVCISPDMDTVRALDVMRSYSLAAVPVVTPDKQLLGLVTEHHYMAIAAQLLLQELGGRMPTA